MQDIFAERERGYEAKWAHDAELQFRILARRNELLGLWAAEKLGLADPHGYASLLVHAGLSGKETDPVLTKVHDDFAAANIDLSDHDIHQKMIEFFDHAGAEFGKVRSG